MNYGIILYSEIDTEENKATPIMIKKRVINN